MGASFSKVINVSLKERVIRELEKSILSGDLQPGDRLPPERELAAAMGISRSLINVCILELESRGFVRIVPRHGTFVNDYKKHGTPQMLLSLMNFESDRMDWSLFDDMMDTRRLLEYECTRLAVQNASDNDIAGMYEALAMMEDLKNAERFNEGNFLFHHILTVASGNALYAMIFNSFGNAIRFFIKHFFSTEERRIQSLRSHRALLEAIQQGDMPPALEAIRCTLDTGIAGLSDIFKHRIPE